MGKIILYHGSVENIRHPEYGRGKPYNDYGLGFYMSQSETLAGEWAVSVNSDGFINRYLLDMDGLKVVDLRCGDSGVLSWLAVLLENRNVRITTPLAEKAKKYIIRNYLPDYKDADVIIGYRADDSYFQFARAFLYNEITVAQLEAAMNLGDLGIQYCVKSKAAFERLMYVDAEPASRKKYLKMKIERDETARKKYDSMLENGALSGVYIMDILRGMENDGSRL